MKLIALVFTRLSGLTRAALIYRCHDGSIKKIPVAIGRKENKG